MKIEGRGSGILLHITSLPSPYGIGDLGPEAYSFADFLADIKQTYWQILPLNPTNPSCGNSPYFSHSAFAANSLLISFERLLDEGLLSAEDIGSVPELTPGVVDHETVGRYKHQVLDKAYQRFKENAGDGDFEKFCSENSEWLENFALFKVLKDEFQGQVWDQWPDALRDRQPEALEKAKKDHGERMEREKFLQYIFLKQWVSLKSYCNGKNIKIIGDIPIYVSYDSADVWVNPHIFKLDKEKKPIVVSGVPPDYFSKTGQLWNNPVYRWDVLKDTGYSWWIRRMEHTFGYYDIVRIDHFRGLVQFWEVPAGEKTAINGQWQDVPTYDFFDTLLEHIPDFPVIVEDLGIITPDVREAMRHYGFPGMKVLQFAFGEDNPEHPYLPHNYERDCVVYTGTHDNNTLVGWLENESTEEERERLFRYLSREGPVEEISWEVIRLAMMSPADTAVIPMQDILGLGEGARMNQPQKAEGNWKWRMIPGQLTSAQADKFRALTELFGRGKH